MSNQEIFNNIYQKNLWGKDSGTGSLKEHAREYINYVNGFIKAYNIKSILDLGMGDTKVFRELDLTNVDEYTGVEVSDFAINKYYKNFKRDVTVINDDIVKCEYPKADLILIKDVLQHLEIEFIKTVMDKIFNSCKYAIITNDILLTENNEDIKNGEYRGLDLKKDPFNYKNLQIINTYVSFQETKAIYLYRKDNEVI
jgi:hypothetical protein